MGFPGKGGLHPSWNRKWKEFFDLHPDANEKEILDQLKKMKKDPLFSEILENGKPANLDYKQWKCRVIKYKKEMLKVKTKPTTLRGVGILGLALQLFDVFDILERAKEAGVNFYEQMSADMLGIDLSDPCQRTPGGCI